MVREFSEEKRQEIFRLLDEIDIKDWKSFMEWCGSRKEEFGDWPDKLSVSAYTRYVDQYHEKVLKINEMTRQQVNTVFENVAEIDARYAARLREHREKVKEQITIVKTMTEFMDSMSNGNPNMALLSGGSVNGNNGSLWEIKEEELTDIPTKSDTSTVGTVENQSSENVTDLGSENTVISRGFTDFIIGSNGKMNSEICMNEIDRWYGSKLINDYQYNYFKYVVSVASNDCIPSSVIGELRVQALNSLINNKDEMNILEKYVNEESLTALGWNVDNVEVMLGDNFIEEMRLLMLLYGLTDEESIGLFLVTISHESGDGENLIEQGDLLYYLQHGYNDTNCGTGFIQLTAEAQDTFLQYILNNTKNNIEKQIIEGLLRGEEDITIQLNNGELVTVSTNKTLFIAGNYPMESAVWYWCKNNDRITVDGTRKSINECIVNYCNNYEDMKQSLIASQMTVNGCKFYPWVLGRVYNPENKVYIDDGKVYIEYREEGASDAGEIHFCAQPENWTARLEKYNTLMYYITGEESYNQPIEEGEKNE